MIVGYADASLVDGHLGVGYHLERLDKHGEYEFLEASGRFLHRNALEREYQTEEAEFRALISAVNAIVEHDDVHDAFILYNDNKGVVDKVTRGERVSEGGYFQHAFLSFANRFNGWDVRWKGRDSSGISESHLQARAAAGRGGVVTP